MHCDGAVIHIWSYFNILTIGRQRMEPIILLVISQQSTGRCGVTAFRLRCFAAWRVGEYSYHLHVPPDAHVVRGILAVFSYSLLRRRTFAAVEFYCAILRYSFYIVSCLGRINRPAAASSLLMADTICRSDKPINFILLFRRSLGILSAIVSCIAAKHRFMVPGFKPERNTTCQPQRKQDRPAATRKEVKAAPGERGWNF